ncbi:MAG TPA: hypothetical protein VFJ30_12065, partial [Phycisphaerae bacterium]|nr:hypothetical protein [Phycisphaerae bacterium]
MAAGCVLAAMALAMAQDKPPTESDPASAPATASAPADEAYGLLAEIERRRGPTFPGKDPAFLVLPRPAERTDMRELLTDEVRAMTDKALACLARSQNADGSFSDKDFPANTGVTALACLAFMAEGSRPRMGRYGKQIDRGLEFLLKNVEDSGIIAGKGSNPYGPMYEHVFSMLALLQACGDMPWRPQTREVLGKGIQAILRSQKLDGGWRYLASSEGRSDLSV